MDPTNGKLVGRKSWALMLTKGSCRVLRLSRATYSYKQTILSMTPRRSGSVLSDFLTNRGQCDQRTHCAEGDIPPRRENTPASFHEDRGHDMTVFLMFGPFEPTNTHPRSQYRRCRGHHTMSEYRCA